MHVAITVVLLLSVVVAGSALSRRFDLSPPLVLIAVGIAGSFVPYLGEVRLSEELVLVGLLPPLLYAASLQTSLIDFKANRMAILLLSVGLVAFTALGVGVVVHAVLPGVSWPAAFALGAVVAPPDAVAATAIARRIGLPRRIVTVLEGESLLNDATALVALRTAVAGSVGIWSVGLDFVAAAGGGVAVGLLVYAAVARLRRYLTDPVYDTSISLLTPFAAYVAAEELHVSGVLAVVVAGLLLGHRSPVLQSGASRIAERVNWQTISFLLENAVFLLIGLQARWIFEEVAAGPMSPGRVALVCAATLAATVLLRPLWVFTFHALLYAPARTGEPRYSWADATVISWAGMRGVVTLAAAFVIPETFAHREVLLVAAFTVVAATLLGQGVTLPLLVRRLELPGPDPRQDALARATLFQEASKAGLERLEQHRGEEDPDGTLEALQRRIEERDFAAWERLGRVGPEREAPSEAYARLRLEMLGAERARVLEVRDTGRVPHDVVEDVLRSLDVEESMLEAATRRRHELRDYLSEEVSAMTTHEACTHLTEAPADAAVPSDPVCRECVEEGTSWVHLRMCLSCGHVGCCDSSPRRHATGHHHDTGHPVVRSAEPGESWRWCFLDQVLG